MLHDLKTPLHMAAMNNSKDIAEILINHGANIDSFACRNWTPLFFAVFHNSL